MAAGERTTEATKRTPSPPATAEPLGRRHLALFLAALFALTLALASRAEAYVYWANNPKHQAGTIGRANLDGSGVDERFITSLGTSRQVQVVSGVAVNSTHLYWVNNETRTIGRARLDGTGANQDFIADVKPSAASFPSGVAVDEEHIYWVSKVGDDFGFKPSSGAIGRANLDGTGVDASFISGVNFPSGGVAVEGSHLYWTSYSQDPALAFADRIGRANLDGTGVEESFITGCAAGLTACVSGVNGLAVDDTHIWWAASGRFDGEIARANLDGTGRETVIGRGEDFFPYGVAVDDTHVYWGGGYSPGSPGAIGRANLDGSRAKHRFITGTGRGVAGGVAVDQLPFTFGKLKRNRKRGTAKLTVNVPGPGELELAKTRKVRGAETRALSEESVKLPVKPKGKAKKRLGRRGRAKVKAKVTFAPEEGEGGTQTKPLKLIKRR